jgi:spore coat protein U-like protein
MNNVSKLAFALGMALVLPSAAVAAGTATSHVTVTASVSNTCTIQDTTLAFNSYDGLVNNLTTDLDGTATLTYQCNNKTVPSIGLGATSNPGHAITGTTRTMLNSTSTDYLSYELYSDLAHTSIWSTGTGVVTPFPTGVVGNSPKNITIYGKIPASQDAPTGSYSDTVTATINF